MALAMAAGVKGTGDAVATQPWMQQAFSKNKGALHRELDVAPGKPIPVKRLQAAAAKAERTGNTKLARRVSLARTGARIARGRK